MVQTSHGTIASIPILIECWTLAKLIYGDSSLQAASLEFQMAQVYGVTGSFELSLKHGHAALALFRTAYAADALELLEAEKFVGFVVEAAGREGREQAERAERLRKKFPKLMADKEIRARISNAPASSGTARRTAAPAPVEAAPSGAPAKKAKTALPQKANLSVDELVSFIQGTPVASSSKAARKRKNSPPATAA